jgi:hypothetical protein
MNKTVVTAADIFFVLDAIDVIFMIFLLKN